jgi:predicted RecA/RadA family phage recombinase
MATNYIQEGKVLDLTAPVGGVTSGSAYEIGEFFGVALKTAAATETFPLAVEGVFSMTILGTDTPSEGSYLYYDDGNSRLTTTASTHKLVAIAVEAKSSGPTTIKAKLIGHNLID